MQILALEPYYGGSHRAFLDGWRAHSRHEFDLLTLPAHHWKWRMRHAAPTFARTLAERLRDDRNTTWDAIWCSDMLDLAAFIGLAPRLLRALPTVAYFHENQLAYPDRVNDPRDVHFELTNLTTCLAANTVWFNSAFNRDSLLDALPALLEMIPQGDLDRATPDIRDRSEVHPPGITPIHCDRTEPASPPRLLWAARWEHDKGPHVFFEAIEQLAAKGVDFRLSIVGEQFRDRPAVFGQAKERFADRIDHFGYQPTRQDYENVLRESDVIVSTAEHEFFGLSVMEAASTGCVPVLPRRLAYPELFDERSAILHDGSANDLATKLTALLTEPWPHAIADAARAVAAGYAWPTVAAALDTALERVAAP